MTRVSEDFGETKHQPTYELFLHDFGNLNVQLVCADKDNAKLESMASNMNHLFAQAGMQSQFCAMVECFEVVNGIE